MPQDDTVPADDMEVLDTETPDEKTGKADKDKAEEPTEEVDTEAGEVEEDIDAEPDEPKEQVEEEEAEPELGPRRPTFKEVKTKYPEFFKDFPGLREAFFRESEYTKVFPTVDDAREASEELESLSVMRDKVLEGSLVSVLESAKETDTATYNKLVRSILPDLYQLDHDAFMVAITPSVENLVRTLYRDGVTAKDEDLQNSALQVSQWFFGTEDVATSKTTTVKQTPAVSEGETKLSQERAKFEADKFRDAHSSVVVDRDAAMEKLILTGLDPDNEMTPYIKNKLVQDIVSEVDTQLQKDSSHMALMNAKWRRAKQEGYSADVKKKILSAYLDRAKSLVPSIRSRLREAALGKTVRGKKAEHVAEAATHREVPAGTPASRTTRLPEAKHIDWRNTSDEDVMAGNIKTRR